MQKKPRRRVIRSTNGEGARADCLRAERDTALVLLQDLDAGRLNPRDLSANQRRACLMILANGSRTSPELAAMFKTTASTIRMDLMLIRRTVGREVKEWTVEEVVGDLAIAAERATALAMKDKDAGLMWTIRKEFAKMLVELGVVEKGTEAKGFRVTVESIGGRYDQVVGVLTQSLDPLITGEVVEAENVSGLPRLPMEERVPGTEGLVVDAEGVVGRKGSLPRSEWPLLEPE